MQFFPDAPAAVAEMHRVLRPGGRVGVAVWRRIEECPLWAATQSAAAEHLDAARAAVLGVPFSWPGEVALLDVLGAAGFADVGPSTHTVVTPSRAACARR